MKCQQTWRPNLWKKKLEQLRESLATQILTLKMPKNISPELLCVLWVTLKEILLIIESSTLIYNLISPKALSLFFSGQPLLLQEMLGWATITLPSKSLPETQSMELLSNMGIPWPLSTLSVAVARGCIVTVLTFMLEVAAQPTSIRVQLKTRTQASRSSRSCETPASTSKHVLKAVEDPRYNIFQSFLVAK